MSSQVSSSSNTKTPQEIQRKDQTAERSQMKSKAVEFAKGAVLGMVVTVTATPVLTLKDLVLSGKGFRHLFSQGPMMAGKKLFTGGLIQSVSTIPAMAIQKGIYASDDNEKLTPSQKMFKSFISGYASAAGCVAADKASLQARQPNEARSPFKLIFANYKKGRLKSVNQGFHLTGMKEGGYSFGYQFLAPWIDGQANAYLPESIPRLVKKMVSSATAVSIMMGLTAPFDKARADQQLSPDFVPKGPTDKAPKPMDYLRNVKDVGKAARARAGVGALVGPIIVGAEEIMSRL